MKNLIIIAGPCVVESFALLDEVCSELSAICKNFEIDFIFKSSYKKANRTSLNSFTGIGDELALDFITKVGEKYNVKTITDVHSVEEIHLASKYVDALQIPAFLSRQTELLIAAGESGKVVNIKKGQFLAPEDMGKAAKKVASTGNENIMLTERGTTFGYHDLVVDYRSLLIMQEFGYPVIYDATHSLQMPSISAESGGKPQFIPALARAAMAVGIDGIFFETHPNPKQAKSDAATQLPLTQANSFISNIMKIRDALK